MCKDEKRIPKHVYIKMTSKAGQAITYA